MVKLFGFWYFFAIAITIAFIIGTYFLLRNKSLKTKKIVLFCFLVLNLVVHFCKAFIEPYCSNPDRLVRDIWFINICGISVLTFPFIFLSKDDTGKDFMFYLGVLSGGLAILYPTEAINNEYVLDIIRFYICHITIFAIPLLMVLLNVHKLNYKRIWKMPFYMLAVLLLVIINQVLQSELGYTSLRGNDIFAIPYKNSSLIWGPTDSIANVFTWLTPDFMTHIPFGEYAGQTKYWPFFYLVPGAFVYFWILPMLLCLFWEKDHIKNDFMILRERIRKNN